MINSAEEWPEHLVLFNCSSRIDHQFFELNLIFDLFKESANTIKDLLLKIYRILKMNGVDFNVFKINFRLFELASKSAVLKG